MRFCQFRCVRSLPIHTIAWERNAALANLTVPRCVRLNMCGVAAATRSQAAGTPQLDPRAQVTARALFQAGSCSLSTPPTASSSTELEPEPEPEPEATVGEAVLISAPARSGRYDAVHYFVRPSIAVHWLLSALTYSGGALAVP
jgi:hypothetical protein